MTPLEQFNRSVMAASTSLQFSDGIESTVVFLATKNRIRVTLTGSKEQKTVRAQFVEHLGYDAKNPNYSMLAQYLEEIGVACVTELEPTDYGVFMTGDCQVPAIFVAFEVAS